VPDSQSASERGGSAKREKPQRTRLASSGGQKPSERQSRQKGASPGGFERTTAQDAFLSSPREARKRISGRKSKTLENISLNTTFRSPYP